MTNQDPPATTMIWFQRIALLACGFVLTALFSFAAWTFKETAEDSSDQFIVLQQAQGQLASEIDREADARREADSRMLEALHALELRMTRNEALTEHIQAKDEEQK